MLSMNILIGDLIYLWIKKTKGVNLNKKTILSGIQPSGNLCIGNYLGALKNWEKLQYDYDSIFLVVDISKCAIRFTFSSASSAIRISRAAAS